MRWAMAATEVDHCQACESPSRTILDFAVVEPYTHGSYFGSTPGICNDPQTPPGGTRISLAALESEGVRLAGNVFKRVPAATAATTAEQAAEGHPLSAPGAARDAALPGVEADDANDDADDELPAAKVIATTEVTMPTMIRQRLPV